MPTKFYMKNKERFRKEARERYQNLSEEEKQESKIWLGVIQDEDIRNKKKKTMKVNTTKNFVKINNKECRI